MANGPVAITGADGQVGTALRHRFEEQRGGLEVLLSTPPSRTELLLGRFLAVAVSAVG